VKKMKKKFLLTLMMLALAGALQVRGVSLELTGAYLRPADGGFREVYGSGGMMPGLRLEANVLKDVSLYASYGYFSRKGTTPVLEAEAKVTQNYVTLGAAWRKGLSEKLAMGLFAGVLYVSYKEEALGETVSDNAVGFDAGVDLRWAIAGKLFLSPFLSYLLANDTVEDVKVKLGGLRAGIGLGMTF
jgi:hypothetical protein